jgi:uncharacterized protein (DUF2249 family)
MISRDLTVARLLDEHPELIEVLASYHPHFRQLRHKLLRRVMAPRVTLAQAARIAGVAADDLLATLRRAVGEGDPAPHPALSPEGRGIVGAPAGKGSSEPRPAALTEVPESRQRHLDVREDIRRNEEPFARIMAAVKALGSDEVLVLRAPFEPIPLYDVLGKRGLAHWTECRAPDDWSVWFYRRAGGEPREAAGAAPAERRSRILDVRGLEPPQPMVRILEELERLEPGQQIEVLHERRPMFLYPQLDERGFAHETDEPGPGLVRIVIRRAGATG